MRGLSCGWKGFFGVCGLGGGCGIRITGGSRGLGQVLSMVSTTDRKGAPFQTGMARKTNASRRMYEGENKHGGSDDQKLDAGAGGRDQEAQAVVRVAHPRRIHERDAAQGLHPPGSGAENPSQVLGICLAVIIFHSKEDKESQGIKKQVLSEESGYFLSVHFPCSQCALGSVNFICPKPTFCFGSPVKAGLKARLFQP